MKKKRRKSVSVRFVMLASCSGVAVLFFLVSTVYIHLTYWRTLAPELAAQQEQRLNFIEITLSESMRSIEMLARSTANNNTIINSVVNYKKNQGNYEQVVFQNNMSRNLSSVAYTTKEIASINILMDDPQLRTTKLNGVYDYAQYTNPEYVKRIRQTQAGWLPLRKNDLKEFQSNVDYIASYATSIYSGTYFGDTLGHLVVNVNESLFYNALAPFDNEGHSTILFIDGDGNILSSTDRACLGVPLAQTMYAAYSSMSDFEHTIRDGKLRTEVQMKDRNMTLLMITDYSYGMRLLRPALYRVLIGSGLLLFIFILFSGLLSYKISSPILDLSDRVRRFDLSQTVIENHNKSDILEVRVLQDAFEQMTKDQKKLTEDLLRQEQEKLKAEMDALQAQINPHFLYNTLESVNWLALSRGQKEISNMVISLGAFLRLSLNKGNNVYTVRDELWQLQSYLQIQNIRSSGKIEYEEDVAPEIMGERMIKLVLQPLVENSILHGFDARGGRGHICLTGKSDGDHIVFVLQDDGCGMTPERIQEITDTSVDGGHGLKNVIRRIRLYYGNEGGMTIDSTPGEGTRIEIRLSKTIRE